MKLYIVWLMLLIFLIPISIAGTEYNETGTTNQLFLAGDGEFNELLTTSLTDSATFSGARHIPLVADLDQDGVNEIILIEDDVLVIRNRDLTDLTEVTIKEGGTFDNLLIFDINADGLPNIIIADQTPATAGNISIYQFNNSILTKIRELDLDIPRTGIEFTEVVLNCGDQSGTLSGKEAVVCLSVWATTPTISGAREITYGAFNFTVTSSQSTFTAFSDANIGIDVCLSQIPVMVYNDYDNDGRKEFISSVGTFRQLSADEIRIFYFDVKDNLTFGQDIPRSLIDFNFDPVTTDQDCDDGLGKFFTSPLVSDIKGDPLKEIIMGVNNDGDDYRLLVFKSTGVFDEDFPKILEADGEILSNVMLMNVFGDTGTEDVCILGHDDDEEILDLLCASPRTSNFVESLEFKFLTTGLFNVSSGYKQRNIITHAAQESNQNINVGGGLTDTHEIITAYGVFRITDDSFTETLLEFNDKRLQLIFPNPIGDAACIPVGLQVTNPPREDILCLTSTQLFLIDDGFSNSPAEIVEEDSSYNPCVIDSTIKLNETLQVSVTVVDPDGDLVTSIVTVYKNDPNAQVSIKANVTSGQIQPHSFTLNQTGDGIIEIQGFDVENPTIIDIQTQTFTVANNGIRFGDSICQLAPTNVTIESIFNVSQDALSNEGIIGFVEGGSEAFKVSPLIFVLILMLAYTIAVLTTKDKMNDSMISMNKVIFMLVGNAFIFIIGSIIGAISFGILLVIVILFIFAVVLWARRQFTADSTT